MSSSTDLNKILPECQRLLIDANDNRKEVHRKVLENGYYQKLCKYLSIYCFYDGIKNNNYHLLVRVCKCGVETDRSSLLEQASKRGYIDISEIHETDGIELHLNKEDFNFDCVFKDQPNPRDVKDRTYMLSKQHCQCPGSGATALR